jgi:hypothetical protein
VLRAGKERLTHLLQLIGWRVVEVAGKPQTDPARLDQFAAIRQVARKALKVGSVSHHAVNSFTIHITDCSSEVIASEP